jgi:hypothetical protein
LLIKNNIDIKINFIKLNSTYHPKVPNHITSEKIE